MTNCKKIALHEIRDIKISEQATNNRLTERVAREYLKKVPTRICQGISDEDPRSIPINIEKYFPYDKKDGRSACLYMSLGFGLDDGPGDYELEVQPFYALKGEFLYDGNRFHYRSHDRKFNAFFKKMQVNTETMEENRK